MQRRTFMKITGAGTIAAFVSTATGPRQVWAAPIDGGTLSPSAVPQFRTRLVVPDRMPRSGAGYVAGKYTDFYEIAMRQVAQQMLPSGLPSTQVFAYGPLRTTGLGAPRTFRSPGMTIEATRGRPVRVRWVNQLVDGSGRYRPHLLPVDPTLHWANPGGGVEGRDRRPQFSTTPGPYTGPVPTTAHVHGATNVGDESDGYPETWYLPDATDIPGGWAKVGSWFDFMSSKARTKWGAGWKPGEATSRYPINDRACLNWYHDHSLGITRLNMYAGLLGMFVIRGGPGGDQDVKDARTGWRATLPGPYPDTIDYLLHRDFGEVPLNITDRSFNNDGSLFYPDSREFFDGAPPPYVPDSDLSPIWNPEFFGNMMVVNGNTWPSMDVDRKRYRFRVLNSCGSRFLILDFSSIPGVTAHIIGNDGGFTRYPYDVTRREQGRILLAPSERVDVIVDFTRVRAGDYALRNVGPDEPYGGGEPGVDFEPADPGTTGRVMQFRVRSSLLNLDFSTPAWHLRPPAYDRLPGSTTFRRLALVEDMSEAYDGPKAALLGTVDGNPAIRPTPITALPWGKPVTEEVVPGTVETWELYNTTEDAHPIHVHESKFEVLNRQPIDVDDDGRVQIRTDLPRSVMRPWETNLKDTVIVYPGELTRIRVRFTTPGQYVWHCHVAEHEDNEMMRPFRIGPVQPGQPPSKMPD